MQYSSKRCFPSDKYPFNYINKKFFKKLKTFSVLIGLNYRRGENMDEFLRSVLKYELDSLRMTDKEKSALLISILTEYLHKKMQGTIF